MKKFLFYVQFLVLCSPAFSAQQIITFDPGTGPEARKLSVEKRGGRVIKDFELINGVLAEFPGGRAPAGLSRLPGVATVEDDEEIYWLASEGTGPISPETAYAEAVGFKDGAPAPSVPPQVSTPVAVSTQPPIYISTVSVDGKADHMSWGTARMRAPAVWPFTKGAGARVAVLDTGMDCAHPDLAPNCAPGANFITPGAPPDDDKGHGSHVAGIIGAALNWKGAVGMAPEATLIPVKVLNSSGTGKISQVLEGINWAVAQKVDIINMSLGSSKYSEAQEKAVKAARAAGVLVVCAAGNSGGAVEYPGAYDGALAVTALNYDNTLADFSCRGPQADFTAPGVKIFSDAPGNSFRAVNGTSQAAPHISGMAALAVGLGVKGADALEKALAKASVSLGLPAYHEGYGVPVALKLLNNLQAPQQPK